MNTAHTLQYTRTNEPADNERVIIIIIIWTCPMLITALYTYYSMYSNYKLVMIT